MQETTPEAQHYNQGWLDGYFGDQYLEGSPEAYRDGYHDGETSREQEIADHGCPPLNRDF